MLREYLDLGERQLHFRSAGKGAPVVLLHPSPLSSAAMVPMATGFAKHFEVFAFDTPGYGQSDPLDQPAESLDDFLATFVQALDRLGIERTCLYGAATGAQFAIQFALQYPERVSLLVLDSCGHIDDEDCARVIDNYFPDTTPRRDGSHLTAVWQASRDLNLFFPWCETTQEARLHIDVPPPEVIQTFVMGYLNAGPDYWRAYRPAFEAERAKHVQRLSVPTVVTRWESSIVLGIADALLAHDMPENVKALPLGAGWDARIEGVVEYVRENYDGGTAAQRPPEPSAYARRYVNTSEGQLHWRGTLSGEGKPVVVIHDPAGSSALTDPIARSFATQRPVVAVDLPGNGESDTYGDATPPDYAHAVESALQQLGLDRVDVFGRYSGSAIGLELSRLNTNRVDQLWLSGALQFEKLDKQSLLEHYTPSIAPRWDGTHLLTAWHMMRDQALFWPWFARSAASIVDAEPKVNPEAIQLRVTELMKCGNRYQDAYASFFRYDLAEGLRTSAATAIFATPPWDPVAADATSAAEALGKSHVTLPAALSDWGASLVKS